MSQTASDRPASLSDRIEQSMIAFFLGTMTLITFANVVARFLDFNILWALEATVFLFAWLVLFGASYAFKHTFHIGIDILVNLMSPERRRLMTLIACGACLAFSVLLLIGSWSYWWPFISSRAFYEVNDIPMPGFLQFLAGPLNEGEAWEKLPRFIPYAVLPLSMALLTLRVVQVSMSVWRAEQDLIVESHEVEEIYEDRSAGVAGASAGMPAASVGEALDERPDSAQGR